MIERTMNRTGGSAKRRSVRVLFFSMLLFLLAGGALRAEALRVVTTTTDLAYFAKRVGGDRVRVESLIRGDQDPHYVDARPDFILKASKADLFVEVGMDLEVGWSPIVLRQARNSRIRKGSPGYCDASRGIRILEKPSGSVSRAMGDIHIYGNPHYWSDPVNASIASRNIRDALIRIDDAHREEYEKNYARFAGELKTMTLDEKRSFAPYEGLKVAVYHKEFVYLAHRFGFRIITSVEEKPGVPPSAAYLKQVVDTMKREGVKIILIAPYQNPRYADRVAERSGAKVLVMPVSVGSAPGADRYEDIVRKMLKLLRDAAVEKGVAP